MFLLNPGRYVAGDPELILKEETLKKLWLGGEHLNALTLKTPAGLIVALATARDGDFPTSLGRPLTTRCGRLAFAPYAAADKLLPTGSVLRLAVPAPTLLFYNARGDIELDGLLLVFRASPRVRDSRAASYREPNPPRGEF